MGLYRPILVTAECGTLTRAAKLLGYTQPSLSYVISGIEADLGVKLFTRDQRGMQLTKAGKQAIDLMRQMEELDQRLREAVHAGEQDLLRVGIFTGVSSQWLPGILSAFFARFPDTRVKLVQQRYYLDGELGVKKGTLDCAFYPGSAPSGLACVPLHQDSYYLITGENHFLGGRKSISLRDLHGMVPFIPTTESFDPGSALWNQVYQELSAQSLVDFEPMENQTCLSMVEEGLGITILPGLALRDLLPGHRLCAVPLLDTAPRTISLLCPSKEDLPMVTSVFLQLTQERVAAWKSKRPDQLPGARTERNRESHE